MENHDKSESEVYEFVLLEKQTGNNTVYSMKEAAREKEIPELFINGEDAVGCVTLTSLKDMEVVRCMAYRLSQIG